MKGKSPVIETTRFLRYIRTIYGNNKQFGLTLGME